MCESRSLHPFGITLEKSFLLTQSQLEPSPTRYYNEQRVAHRYIHVCVVTQKEFPFCWQHERRKKLKVEVS